MAATYSGVPQSIAINLGMSQMLNGDHSLAFIGPSDREVYEKMDQLKAEVEAAGGTELRRTKIGRNTPCPCGSGLKFKKCCIGRAIAA